MSWLATRPAAIARVGGVADAGQHRQDLAWQKTSCIVWAANALDAAERIMTRPAAPPARLPRC